MASKSTQATVTLTRAKVPFAVHDYPHDPRSQSYGDEAVTALAQRLGVEPTQIFKTLVVELSDQRLAVAVIPVPSMLSLKAAARAFATAKAVMAPADAAQRATGYVLGGISPIGHRRRLPVAVDDSALGWDRVLCSGGRRGLEIELAPADLIGVSSAVVASLTA